MLKHVNGFCGSTSTQSRNGGSASAYRPDVASATPFLDRRFAAAAETVCFASGDTPEPEVPPPVGSVTRAARRFASTTHTKLSIASAASTRSSVPRSGSTATPCTAWRHANSWGKVRFADAASRTSTTNAKKLGSARSDASRAVSAPTASSGAPGLSLRGLLAMVVAVVVALAPAVLSADVSADASASASFAASRAAVPPPSRASVAVLAPPSDSETMRNVFSAMTYHRWSPSLYCTKCLGVLYATTWPVNHLPRAHNTDTWAPSSD